MSRRALGVDVSFSRGLDAVVLNETGELVLEPRNTNPAGLRALVEEVKPDIVAIDSPPEWAREGRSRLIERQLQRWVFTSTPARPTLETTSSTAG